MLISGSFYFLKIFWYLDAVLDVFYIRNLYFFKLFLPRMSPYNAAVLRVAASTLTAIATRLARSNERSRHGIDRFRHLSSSLELHRGDFQTSVLSPQLHVRVHGPVTTPLPILFCLLTREVAGSVTLPPSPPPPLSHNGGRSTPPVSA